MTLLPTFGSFIGGIFDFRHVRVGFGTWVAFWPLAVKFGPSGFNFAFWESILGLRESILGIWKMLFEPHWVYFGPMRVNFGQMEVVFCPMNGEFRHCFLLLACERQISALFFNFTPLGVDFLCVWVNLGILAVVIRPLRVNYRPLGVDFGLEKLILELCDLSFGSGSEIYLKFVVVGLLE